MYTLSRTPISLSDWLVFIYYLNQSMLQLKLQNEDELSQKICRMYHLYNEETNFRKTIRGREFIIRYWLLPNNSEKY